MFRKGVFAGNTGSGNKEENILEAKEISKAVIKRLPRYYRYLGELMEEKVERISSNDLSKKMHVSEKERRKDENKGGGGGKKGEGEKEEERERERGKRGGGERRKRRSRRGGAKRGKERGNEGVGEKG